MPEGRQLLQRHLCASGQPTQALVALRQVCRQGFRDEEDSFAQRHEPIRGSRTQLGVGCRGWQHHGRFRSQAHSGFGARRQCGGEAHVVWILFSAVGWLRDCAHGAERSHGHEHVSDVPCHECDGGRLDPRRRIKARYLLCCHGGREPHDGCCRVLVWLPGVGTPLGGLPIVLGIARCCRNPRFGILLSRAARDPHFGCCFEVRVATDEHGRE
mmetsp:Transcript_160320/g.514436  ORF Transcript_160320/g.514436 Transcript_160320/m.514436 type:complete len:213 (+) Transcript_160320:249-887(+)